MHCCRYRAFYFLPLDSMVCEIAYFLCKADEQAGFRHFDTVGNGFPTQLSTDKVDIGGKAFRNCR
jgi:hypothetical protein